MEYRIGMELGAGQLAVGVVDASGRMVSRIASQDHTDCDEDGVLDRMERNLDQALSAGGIGRSGLKGVGVLYPGHVLWPDGVAIITSNLKGFRRFPLKKALKERLGLPVKVDNDANAQALGEFWYGAGRGCRHMVYLTVGAGVGGGIIIDGKLYRGASGSAGEFGHMTVDATASELCACGNRGCLMAMVSGIALQGAVRRVARRLGVEADNLALPEGCADLSELDLGRLAAGCAKDNELCQEVVWEFGTYIGIGLYNIFQILNPERVILGGSLAGLPQHFFDTARSACYDRAGIMMHDVMDIRKGELGEAAGIIGAAALFEA